MRKLLLVAFFFPPLGGGVQRPLKWVKYLPNFGWRSTVLTTYPSHVKYVRDLSLSDEIPGDTKVYRAFFPNIELGLRGWLGKCFFRPLERRFFVPDKEVGWIPFAYRKALKIVRHERPEVVLTTSPPFSTTLLGERLKREFGLRLILDMRDEWTNNPYHLEERERDLSPRRLSREKELESRAFRGADKILCVSEIMAQNFQELIGIPEEKCVVIRNGFDPQDFDGLERDSREKDGKLRFVYNGSLSLSSPDTFLLALSRAIETSIIDPDKIEVTFITGSSTKRLIKKFETLVNLGCVKLKTYLPHKESLREVMKHDVLLLLIPGQRGNESIYKGKIFEYINCNRPILGLVPSGGVADKLIQKTRTGTTVEPEDMPGMLRAISNLYREWQTNTLTIDPDWEEIIKYDRKRQTGKLAEVLDEVAG
ncbi:MAG: glycosyltransferase [bacterium]